MLTSFGNQTEPTGKHSWVAPEPGFNSNQSLAIALADCCLQSSRKRLHGDEAVKFQAVSSRAPVGIN
jgi:hypothetical protein